MAASNMLPALCYQHYTFTTCNELFFNQVKIAQQYCFTENVLPSDDDF